MKKFGRRLLKRMPIRLRRKLYYLKAHHRWPNFDQPISFNEKINWRILHDRRQELEWTCDKILMKEFASKADSTVKVPKTLWAGTDLSELVGFDFPERWILKANHRSQCVYPGEGNPSLAALQDATSGWLDDWQASQLGEWAYGFANRTILLEEWIGDGPAVPDDYKFFVFHGRVEMIQLDQDRFVGHKLSLYDREWNPVAASKSLWESAEHAPMPANLPEMIKIAETLGSHFDFMRIDLFATKNGIYFGETTPYPGGGLSRFKPHSFDVELGHKWVLPQ